MERAVRVINQCLNKLAQRCMLKSVWDLQGANPEKYTAAQVHKQPAILECHAVKQ